MTDKTRAKLWATVNENLKHQALRNKTFGQSVESYVRQSNPRSIYAGRLIVECFKIWYTINNFKVSDVEKVFKQYSFNDLNKTTD